MLSAILMTWLVGSAISAYIGCELAWQGLSFFFSDRVVLWWYCFPLTTVLCGVFAATTNLGAIGLVGFLIIWIGYLMGAAASIHQLFSSRKVK